MNLALVRALTLHAHALQEAASLPSTKPAVAKIILATAQAADEAARLVQHNNFDQLTDKQRSIIDDLVPDWSSITGSSDGTAHRRI
jgi:hypothetical protein